MAEIHTGIIRRIDDLGRLIVPKEIRRRLGIHENDPFEVVLTEEGVLFRKDRGLKGHASLA